MERLIGIPLETALNGMPGLEDLRSTSVAGLNDIKCQFAYGTDYWTARQEVINRIGVRRQPAAGRHARALALEPDRRDRPLRARRARATRLNQLKAVQDWVLNRALKTVPGVIDVTGYGGTVKQYQVLIDTRLLRQYNVTLQQVEDAIAQLERQRRRRHPHPGQPGAQRPRASGCSARGSTRSTRPTSTAAVAIEAEKLEDIQQGRHHHGQRHPDLRPAGRQGRSSATGRGSGIVGREVRTRTTSSRASS